MNPHLLKDITTPDTALIAKHAGWAAARSGKEAWGIDCDNTSDGDNWFTYTPEDIRRMHYVRDITCTKLRNGDIP